MNLNTNAKRENFHSNQLNVVVNSKWIFFLCSQQHAFTQSNTRIEFCVDIYEIYIEGDDDYIYLVYPFPPAHPSNMYAKSK